MEILTESDTETIASAAAAPAGQPGNLPVKVSQQFLVQALRSGHDIPSIANILNVAPAALEEVVNAYGLRDLAARTKQLTSIDTKLNNIEDTILDKLETSLNRSLVPLGPMDYARMLAIVNGAKRKTADAGNPLVANGAPRLVNIQLPTQIKVDVTVNALGQVSQIDGREINTIDADALSNISVEAPIDLPTALGKGLNNEQPRIPEATASGQIEHATNSTAQSPANKLHERLNQLRASKGD